MLRTLFRPLFLLALSCPASCLCEETAGETLNAAPGISVAQAEAVRVVPVSGRALSAMFVKDDRDHVVARVQELVIEPREGVVVYAAISFGRAVDMGDVVFVVPWDRIETLPGSHELRLTIAPDLVKGGPRFGMNSWPNFADREYRAAVERYYAEAGAARRVPRVRPIVR